MIQEELIKEINTKVTELNHLLSLAEVDGITIAIHQDTYNTFSHPNRTYVTFTAAKLLTPAPVPFAYSGSN
jgi:hypothetical protein